MPNPIQIAPVTWEEVYWRLWEHGNKRPTKKAVRYVMNNIDLFDNGDMMQEIIQDKIMQAFEQYKSNTKKSNSKT